MTTRFITQEQMVICSAARASQLVMSTHTRGEIDSLLSIADSYAGKRPPRDGFYRVRHRLALTFDDCLEDSAGCVAPTREDVQNILAFGRAARVRDDKRMLIHCLAGVSRSTAAGLLILAQQLGPGHEAQACELLIQACEDKRPFPNELMLRLGDELLGLEGRLVRASESRHYRLGGLLSRM